MSSPYLTWPRLLGSSVAGVALGFLLLAGGRIRPDSPAEQRLWLVWVVGCALFGLLSLPLLAARGWARRVLLVVAILVTLFCVFRSAQSFFAPVSHYESIELWVKRRMMIESIAGTLLLVTPPAFFVLLLSQPDVVASFRRSKVSEQAPNV